jgi:uncharacterized membrane protein
MFSFTFFERVAHMNIAWFPVLLICVALLAISLVLLGFPRGGRTKAKTPADLARISNQFRDDDRYWYAGFCYYNPDDPALFVLKRFGGGWTVNFGHPGGKLFLIVIVLVLLLSTVLLPILTSGSAPTGCHSFGCTP